MALTEILSGTGIAAQQYSDQATHEWMGKTYFKGYAGTGDSDVIYMKEELTKQKGDIVNCPLVMALDGEGVEGDSTLEGSEESLVTYNQAVTLTQYRNALRTKGKLTVKRPAIDLLAEFRPGLESWNARKFDRNVINAMGAINGTVLYGSASEANKDAWIANNNDRVLFGAATTNYSTGDHSASLLNVDSTTDTLLPAQISLAKRMAQLCDPKIRPWRIDNGLEFYVLFAHPYCCRDLKNNSTFQNAQRDAMPRGLDNPLFTGAIGYWDGVLVVECELIPLLDNVGASSIDVARNFLCGAQACVWALGAYEGGIRTDFVEEDFDYEEQQGMAVRSMYKVDQGYYNSKVHGIVVVCSAAVAD